VNQAWYDTVEAVNRHKLLTLVGELVDLRQRLRLAGLTDNTAVAHTRDADRPH
jgi:hypothetical protein